MSEIHRFSLVYDIPEDRIAWDVEDTEGVATRLWLTQRLCRALLTAIFPMVQAPAAADLAAEHESTLQSWEQAAAMSEFGKVPAVTPNDSSTAGLVRQINLAPSGETTTLTFEFGDGEVRTLGVGRAELRQTLSVLYRLQAAAGWPLDLWPDWITGDIGSAAEVSPARH